MTHWRTYAAGALTGPLVAGLFVAAVIGMSKVDWQAAVIWIAGRF